MHYFLLQVREKIELDRGQRVKLAKLPNVNKGLAMKLREKQDNKLLGDDRFQTLFTNPDFEIDTNADEYRLINPVVSKGLNKKEKQLEMLRQFTPVEEEEQMKGKKVLSIKLFWLFGRY